MEKLIQFCTSASLYDGAFDSVAGWSAAGMGYVIVTKNNRFIVIDGGHGADAPALLDLLEKYAGNKKPCVEFWILTHSHLDHYGALQNISEDPELRARVDVKNLCYYFPANFRDKGKRLCNLEALDDMRRIAILLDAFRCTPDSDKKFSFDGIDIHFLYVPRDCSLIDGSYNSNACSVIFTAQAENKKIMFTGDAVPRTLLWTANTYEGQLNCDILQMPHHALCDTGEINFYREVNAKAVLLPISVAGDRSMKEIYFEQNEANRWAQENADQIFKAFDGTVEINI